MKKNTTKTPGGISYYVASYKRWLHPDVLKGHPFVIPVVTFMALFFVSIIAFVGLNATSIRATDARIVQVSVNGEHQILPTRAPTVKKLLARMNIEVNPEDIVEPGIDEQISEDNFHINVYKARPVSIIDGGKKITKITAEPTPERIAKEAGMPVHPEDRIEKQTKVVEAADIMREGIVAEEVIIERATPAVINLYGRNIEIRTHAATVGELLEEKGIQLEEDDSIQPSAETVITSNAQIFVTRVGLQIDTVEEEIPMPEETIDDPTMLFGTTRVRQEGSPGKKVVTYEIELENGEEVGRKIIQEVIATQPQKRVVVRGTKVVIANPSANVRLGERMAAQRGWTGEQWGCLYQLWQKESGWNHLAMNPSSGAYGIPQSLPGSKMATVGADWQTNPETQITWGMNYISGRYGTPCSAWSKSQAVGWY
jgi:resuscitation-promoting factor RpfB